MLGSRVGEQVRRREERGGGSEGRRLRRAVVRENARTRWHAPPQDGPPRREERG